MTVAVHLADLTWPEVAARAPSALLAVPVGATEQHGPHLPLRTDTAVAVELCERLARTRADVLVAPAVAFGSSGEHAAFAGTLSIGAEATEALLVELGRSADAFAGVVFVSAHGGNAGPVGRAAAKLRSEGRRVRAWGVPAVEPVDGALPVGAPAGRPGDAHAGWVETSVLLALAPEAVRAEQARAGCVEPLAAILPRLREGGVAAVSANGVLGDPAGASAEAGRALLGHWATRLAADLDGWP